MGYKRAISAGRSIMDCLHQQFFPHAGFTQNKHRGRGFSNALPQHFEFYDRFVPADNIFEGIARRSIRFLFFAVLAFIPANI